MIYAGVWIVLFGVTAAFNMLLPNPLSILMFTCPAFLYVVPVAVYTHFGNWWKSLGLIMGALLSALAGCGLLLLIVWLLGLLPKSHLTQAQIAGLVALIGANAVLGAAIGLPIGIGTARRWTYSKVVVATVATFGTIVIAYLALAWDGFNRIMDRMIVWFTEELNRQVAIRGQDAIDNELEGLRWFGENKFAFTVGVEFGVYVALICVFVSVTALVLRRRFAEPGPASTFRDMHPPDWLVWVAIGTALLWFVERHYGGVELRFLTWNMAIGLGSIYFLNGCAILVYGFQVLAPGALLVVMFVFLMLTVGVLPVLSSIGFFDTWANFRRRVDRLAEALRNARSGES